MLLLHGITASGRTFGGAYDQIPGTVVVPDLLGFGRSMDVPTDAWDVEDHVEAVRATLEDLGLADRPTLVVGHSMGSVLALHLAPRLARPLGVVAMSAPLYRDEDEALDHIGEADPLAGLLATGDLAERICRWMCDNRRLAAMLWPLAAPRYPWQVAADGVLHTWPAYIGSLRALVLRSGYEASLAEMADRDLPLLLVDGADDGVPVTGRADRVVDLVEVRGGRARHVVVDGADHALPMSDATTCVELVVEALVEWQRPPEAPQP